MRGILTSLLQLFPPKRDDLVEREGILYENSSKVPFTGKITKGWEQGEVIGGKRVGHWNEYHKDEGIVGKKKSYGTYKDGKMDGPWVFFHSNGHLRSEGTTKDGKEEGHWVHWHRNKVLESKGTYKNGKLHGRWVCYYEDGTVVEDIAGTYEDGEKVEEGSRTVRQSNNPF
jgi:antitoxin component YwqK of YwqJK toxin-antitoxin module